MVPLYRTTCGSADGATSDGASLGATSWSHVGWSHVGGGGDGSQGGVERVFAVRARLAVVGHVLGNVALVRAQLPQGDSDVLGDVARDLELRLGQRGRHADRGDASRRRGSDRRRRRRRPRRTRGGRRARRARSRRRRRRRRRVSARPHRRLASTRPSLPARAPAARRRRRRPPLPPRWGRASAFVVVGKGRRRSPRASLRWRPRNGDASARVAVPAGNARAAPTAIERVIVHSPRVLSSASTSAMSIRFHNPTLRCDGAHSSDERSRAFQSTPAMSSASAQPPPSAPRSSRSAG